MFKIAKRDYLALLVALVLIVFVQTNIIPLSFSSGISGKHEGLSCELCHGAAVWHKTTVDLTICKTCHAAQWSTLEASMHKALMKETVLNVTSGTARLAYCATCHSPHHPDVLQLRYINGTVAYVDPAKYTELCYKCHTLSGVTNIVMSDRKTETSLQSTPQPTTPLVAEKAPSVISLAPSLQSVAVGSTITLSGEISPSASDSAVILYYRLAGTTDWNRLSVTQTDTAGKYTYDWTPPSPGNYEIKVEWLGNENYIGSNSDIQTISVTSKSTGLESVSWFPNVAETIGIPPLYLFTSLISIIIVVVTASIYYKKVRVVKPEIE